MPEFVCKICKEQIVYPEALRTRLEKQGWECFSCYSVIAKKRYPLNQKRTLFSPNSFGLGDVLVYSVVKEQYKKDNPGEEVIQLAGVIEAQEALAKYHPDKFFWSNISSFCKEPGDNDVIKYSMVVEAQTFANMGIYPKWDEFDPFYDFKDDRFAVLHIRNIAKCPEKNIEQYFACRLQILLEKMITDGKIKYVVLIGNDQKMMNETFDYEKFYDMRNKLTLPQIAHVLRHAKLLIGKDSGIAHLAGAVGTPGVAWGYWDRNWFVKAAPGLFNCYLKENSRIDVIEREINRRLAA